MPGIGPWELVIILLIVVVLFGAGRLSEIGGALGKSVREFRKATQDEPKPDAPTETTPPPTAAATNTCPSCGTVSPAGQTFCGQCGTRLTRAA